MLLARPGSADGNHLPFSTLSKHDLQSSPTGFSPTELQFFASWIVASIILYLFASHGGWPDWDSVKPCTDLHSQQTQKIVETAKSHLNVSSSTKLDKKNKKISKTIISTNTQQSNLTRKRRSN